MSYFIIGLEETQQIHLDDRGFIEALMRDWPGTQIKPCTEPNSPFLFEWETPCKTWKLGGFFYKSRDALSFDGQWDDCLIFALWCRIQLSEQPRLLFFDQGFNFDMELKPSTTAEEISAALASGASELFKT